MIEQENVNLIVMLTSLQENGKVKCEQYWPQEIQGEWHFENGKSCVVLLQEEILMPNLIQRKLAVYT